MSKRKQNAPSENVEELKILLEQKNRELEIEAALEHIRAKMMSMKKSSELSGVIRLLFEEAILLGFGAKACDLVILDSKTGSSEFWISGELNSEAIHFTVPELKLKHYQEALLAWKKRRKLRAAELKGSSCQAYMKKLVEAIPKTKSSGKALKIISELRSIHHTEAYMKYGFFRVAGNRFLSKDEEGILRRFANVFEQTYTRFLDLQKAEAQAREAQIEAALERVRAVAMGMNHPDEMIDVCRIISEQLKQLNTENIRNVQTAIINDKKGTYLNYEYFTQYDTSSILEIQSDLHPRVLEFVKSIKKSKDAFFTTTFAGKDLEEWIEYRIKTDQIPDPLLAKATSVHYYFYSIGPGALGLSTYVSLVPEQLEVFKKFHNVFSLAYKRFLDIQKAEGQAREAQIEAALERVRSRSMGMHKSEELKDVVKVIFDQLARLNINAEHAGIVVDYEPKKDWHFWIAETQDIPAKVTVPYLDLVWDRQFTAAKKKGKDFFTTQLDFDEKNNFYKVLLPHIEGLTKKARDYYFNCPGLAISTVIRNDIGLYIENFSGTPYTMQENDILTRFAKVFQQTYTRFLDLQKAEAQAREAQIEAALERFRSRMLGMQKSSELEETTTVMYKQLNSLGIVPEGSMVYIVIADRKTDTAVQWIVSDNTLFIPPEGELRTPMNEHPQLIKTYEAWKRQEPMLIRDLSGEELNDLKNYFISLPSFRKVKTDFDEWPDRLVWSEASFSNGTLGLIYETQLPEATIDILIRFSRVFDLTYTRFLDIQKAETQAREAQIEAALERVRARSMAMHKSEELQEVMNTVFDQLNELKIDTDVATINISKEGTKEIECWLQTTERTYSSRIVFPYFNKSILSRELSEATVDNRDIVSRNYSLNEKNEWFNLMFSDSEMKGIPDSRKQFILDAESFTFSLAMVKYSGMSMNRYSDKPITKTEHDILKRFANVFEQAYIRFLDLQQAEAQAREAQIEAALEKVRSQSLAMHQSTELQQVVNTVFEQMNDLKIGMDHTAIVTLIEGSKDYDVWVGSALSNFNEFSRIPFNEKTQVQRDYNKAIDSRPCLFNRTYTGKIKKQYSQYLFSDTGFKTNTPKKELKLMAEGNTLTTSIAMQKNTGIQIVSYQGNLFSEDDNEILIRFAKVFEQAYIRFTDLQKAEAQAREAQIEAALEKAEAE